MALPRAQRDVVILYYLQERSHREVATSLGIPATIVNNRLHAARKTLVGYLSTSMGDDATAVPPSNLDEVLGSIRRVDGSLLEVRFRNGTQPTILNSVAMPDHNTPLTPAAFVSQHLPDGSVRCVAVTRVGTMRAGTGIVDTRESTDLVVESPLLDRILHGVTRRPAMPRTVVETGIKVIDLLCPIVRGGRVGIFGPVGAGKLVIATELIYRLSTVSPSISLLYFVQPGTELSHLHALPDPLPSSPAPMQTIYLPIENPADLSAVASAAARKSVETTLYMSRDLVIRRLYPAVYTFVGVICS